MIDAMLDAFWRSWPWPLVILVALLFSGGAGYIGWLSRENWLKRRAEDECDPASCADSEHPEQMPNIQPDDLDKKLLKKSASA